MTTVFAAVYMSEYSLTMHSVHVPLALVFHPQRPLEDTFAVDVVHGQLAEVARAIRIAKGTDSVLLTLFKHALVFGAILPRLLSVSM